MLTPLPSFLPNGNVNSKNNNNNKHSLPLDSFFMARIMQKFSRLFIGVTKMFLIRNGLEPEW